MEILKDFGVDPILLIAQIVNFLILLFILNRILFKPLLKVLEERKQTIAKSLQEAEQISKELARATQKSQGLIEGASTQADKIVEEAKKAAEKIKEEQIQATKVEAENIFRKNRDNIELEKEKMRASLRSELQEVLVLAVEKVVGKTLSKEERETITKSSVKEIN